MKTFSKLISALLILASCSSSDEKVPDSFVISTLKMNVLYIGVENPIAVSVPGFMQDQINVKMENGTVTGQNGNYNIKVSTFGTVPLQIFVKLKNGKELKVGEANFRCKGVPNPVASFAGKTNDDIISIAELEKDNEVQAMIPNFDFDLKFRVTSFDLSALIGGTEVTETTSNGSISDGQNKLIHMLLKSLEKGDKQSGRKIYIDNVKVQGPDGTIRAIPGLILKVI